MMATIATATFEHPKQGFSTSSIMNSNGNHGKSPVDWCRDARLWISIATRRASWAGFLGMPPAHNTCCMGRGRAVGCFAGAKVALFYGVSGECQNSNTHFSEFW